MNEKEREYLIEEAERGRRGQGGVVKATFILNDSIEALEQVGKRLSNRLVYLTWATAIVAAFIVVDIVVRWFSGR